MDCTQASQIISAAHDGELVDAALLTEARAHAQTCAECAVFARVLDRIATAPAPGAPPELVAHIGEIAAGMSGLARSTSDGPDARPARVHLTRRDRGRLAWLPRFAAAASVAAVLLVAITAGGVVLLSRAGQTANEVATKRTDSGEVLMAEDAAPAAAEASAPFAFVSLNGEVYALAGVTDTAPPSLAPAGDVLSGSGGSPVERAAFHPSGDRSVLYVADDDGGYQIFGRVVRTLDGRAYGLMTATPIGSFGEWPSLPGPSPERADGWPVFESAGYDDLRVKVFVPTRADIADGFAIAPGTAPDDPAAGNPGWTWWEPLP